MDTMIRKWVTLPQNPFLAFVDLHGFYPRRPDSQLRPKAMMDALHAVYTYGTMDDTDLRACLTEDTSKFGHVEVSGYQESYEHAVKFMRGLRSAVDHVDISYWPESATSPRAEPQEYELSGWRLLGSLSTPDGQKLFEAELEKAKREKAAKEGAGQSDSEVAQPGSGGD